MQPGIAVFGSLLAFAAGVNFVFQQAVNANLRIDWIGLVDWLRQLPWWDGRDVTDGNFITRAGAIGTNDSSQPWHVLDRRHLRCGIYR